VTTAAKRRAPRKGTAPRKAATRTKASANGNGSAPLADVVSPPQEGWGGEEAPPAPFVPPTNPVLERPEAEVPEHPYGDTKVYVFRPRHGQPIVLPHISTCQPSALFLYDNRNKDQLRQCFAWMDQAGVPDSIGRRIWMLSDEEQAACVAGWFQGLELRQPQGVSPPGES
jgi:hypothetical protein